MAALWDQAAGGYGATFRYDPYGELLSSPPTGTTRTPWRYQGRMVEGEAGDHELYDFGFRSYAADTGAFASLDSVPGSAQDPISLNRFLYAHANPTTLVDPTGHCPQLILALAGPAGAAGGVLSCLVGTAVAGSLAAGIVVATNNVVRNLPAPTGLGPLAPPPPSLTLPDVRLPEINPPAPAAAPVQPVGAPRPEPGLAPPATATSHTDSVSDSRNAGSAFWREQEPFEPSRTRWQIDDIARFNQPGGSQDPNGSPLGWCREHDRLCRLVVLAVAISIPVGTLMTGVGIGERQPSVHVPSPVVRPVVTPQPSPSPRPTTPAPPPTYGSRVHL